MPTTIVCTHCACFCADIAPPKGPGAVWHRACDGGQAWLSNRPPLEVKALVRGEPVGIAEAIEAAAVRINEAAAPQVRGLSWLTLEAQREALRLVERVDAAISMGDPGYEVRAGLDAPELTASWSSAAANADLIIYWGGDPQTALPRHRELFAGPRTVAGKQRQVIVAANAGLDDALRLAERLRGATDASSAESPLSARLASALGEAAYAHIHCLGPAAADVAVRDVLGELAARLRPQRKLTVSSVNELANGRGAREVVSWLLGVPGNMHWLADQFGATLQPVWIPAATASWNAATDLIVQFGPGAVEEAPRIAFGEELDNRADVSFRIPGLDPRLAATVVRADGMFLTLCGDSQAGQADPAVEILRRLRAVVAPCTEGASV